MKLCLQVSVYFYCLFIVFHCATESSDRKLLFIKKTCNKSCLTRNLCKWYIGLIFMRIGTIETVICYSPANSGNISDDVLLGDEIISTNICCCNSAMNKVAGKFIYILVYYGTQPFFSTSKRFL